MEPYSTDGMRGLLPESVRVCYRSLRAWVLSVNLRPEEPPPLSNAEREASAGVSVVVPVHDAPEVTSRCLGSLERFGGEAEVIVVDDGSKLDRTRRVLDDFCSENHWQLVRNQKPTGHSRASESGVLVSGRPYVCLLNSDTVVTPHSWLGVVRAFEGSADVAVAGPSTSQTPTPQSVRRALYCRHYWSDEQIWSYARRYVARHLREPVADLPMVGGFAFFVRRAVWDGMGGFDKNLPDYGNEKEFCGRVKRAGARIVWTKGSYIHHLGSESYGRTIGIEEVRRRCRVTADYVLGRTGPHPH
jgi:GT2 family glycosyltransferase